MTDLITVQQLKVNEWMKIEDIVTNHQFGYLDALVSQRLLDLGFVKGMTLLVLSKGLFNNGPYAVRLSSNMQFSLRHSEAIKIIGHQYTDKDIA